MKKQINKKIIITTFILMILISNIMPISNAARLSGEVNIYFKSFSKELIKYQDKNLSLLMHVYRNNDGVEYEAYNALYPTYGFNNTTDEELLDENSYIWKVVANGFPNKTKEELGCNTYEEAFTATQIAIYCAYCGHLRSDYTMIDGSEASERVYNAFINILDNAMNNTVNTDKNTVVKLINNQNEWQIDDENKTVYKTYKVKANFEMENYNVEVLNFKNVKITDEQNNIKTTFNKEEVFKISLPMNELNNDGEFDIKITTDIKTMPIYLGTSSSNKYILTAPKYEKKEDIFTQNYQENLTSINVKIQELDTKIGIENAQIKLLDSNKQLISNLTTNEQGKIFIEHLLPGKYYIEQSTTEDGYNTYKKQIELDMDYNKVVTLTINNSKINIQNFFHKEENIEIQEEIVEKNYDNEITDKNINNKTDITNENNTHNSYTENNNTTETNKNNTNNNTNVNNKTDVTNENNTNNSYTENNNTTEKNQNNNNTNTNVNNTTNKNNTNNNTNVNNKTNVTNENNTHNSYTENNTTTETNKNNNNANANINNNTNKNGTNNKNTTYLSENTSTKNQGNVNTYYTNTENVKKLPKTGM